MGKMVIVTKQGRIITVEEDGMDLDVIFNALDTNQHYIYFELSKVILDLDEISSIEYFEK